MENRILTHLKSGWDPYEEARPPVTADTAMSKLRGRAEDLIAEKPMVGLGVALVLGVALGWLIKRR